MAKKRVYRPFDKALTHEQCAEKLAMTACGLDRLAHWTEKDNKKYTSPVSFAKMVMKMIGCSSMYKEKTNVKQTSANDK